MKRKSIFLQLILILFLVTAIPSCLIVYRNSREMERLFRHKIIQSATDKLKAKKDLCDETLTNLIYDVLDLVLARRYSDLNGILSYEALNSSFESVNAAVKMQADLRKLSDRSQLVYSIFYYMDGADYVISTDNGLVKLEDYEDLNWLEKAGRTMTGAQGIWCARRAVPNPAYAGRQEVSVLSFLYRLNSLTTSTRGTIVVNVYEEGLSRMISSAQESAAREAMLLDSSGNVLSHTDKAYLYGNLKDREDIKKILSLAESSGFEESQSGKEAFFYVWQKSDLYDWYYINTYSEEYITAESAKIVQMGVAASLVIALIGAVCAVLVSFKFAWPIRKLARQVQRNGYESCAREQNMDEIQYLEGAFSEIRKREQLLMQKISEGEESILHETMTHLLYGEPVTEKNRLLLEERFPYDHYMAAVLLIDHCAKYQSTTTHEQREIIRYQIYELARELCPEEFLLNSTRFIGGSVAIVLNMKNYDSTIVNATLRTFMRLLQKKCEETFSFSVSVGISMVHRYLSSLKECADEAYEAVKYRLLQGRGCLLFYTAAIEDSVPVSLVYQQEKHILNYLETEKLEEIEKELDFLEKKISGTRGISVENAMLVFNQLAGVTLVYLNRHNYNATAALGAGSNLYSALAEFETLEEVIDYFKSIYRKIIDYQKAFIREEEDYGKMILKYLHANFQKDIDFEEMAEKVGISYSYLRKIIKEETGKTLIDTLNEMRIESAKELLKETEETVAQIAETVGYHNAQSLNRFFQKYEGISPTEYRQKNQF